MSPRISSKRSDIDKLIEKPEREGSHSVHVPQTTPAQSANFPASFNCVSIRSTR